jgi:hypothetical protein
VCLVDLCSFLSTPHISKKLNFQLPDSLNLRPDRAGGWNRRLSFSRETNHRPVTCHSYKVGTTVHIVSRHFSLLPSHLLLPSPFTAPWLTPLFMPPLLSLLHRPTPMTQGMTLGGKHRDGSLFFSNSWRHKKWRRGKSQNSPTSSRRRPSSVLRPWMADW